MLFDIATPTRRTLVADKVLNLALPGNPRYQPKDLVSVFGYDYLYRAYVMVEIAMLEVLAEIGVIPHEEYALLTADVRADLLAITTTEVDELERKVTKHDIRALVQIMQSKMPEALRRWVHLSLTSYDVIDTARALQFTQAQHNVIAPKMAEILRIFADRAEEHAETLQMGRTHLQHAVPITAGFWLATILSRLIDNAVHMNSAANGLVGKIAGPVGACNAQVQLGIYRPNGDLGFSVEERVMLKLGLRAAPVSTQIVPPEPLARYLFAVYQTIAAFGQFGNDGRQLMRTEVAELCEPFESKQIGSSAMPHKRNPITFEGLVGAWKDAVAEFLKVQLTVISDHQRDLTDSSVMRDFPTMLVLLVRQMDSLLRKGQDDREFLRRIAIDPRACRKNFDTNAHLTLAEPLHGLLQRYGFTGDAHELVNRKLVPVAARTGKHLVDLLELGGRHPDNVEYPDVAVADWEMFAQAFSLLPPEVVEDLRHPERYVGRAPQIARETAVRAREVADTLAPALT